MKIYRQLGIILGVCLTGQLIASIFPFPFPASVAAMLLLFLLLWRGALKLDSLQPVADFLVQNMAILFVPTLVSIMGVFGSVKQFIWPLLAVCIVSTILTGVVTAGVTLLVIRLQNGKKEEIK
ncbi:MAG: CidA/LrgA family protein [Angelakisella sp.]|nr:CidA/LrgA family protein [Angelakisella sp.]